MKIGLDTNILVRYFTRDDDKQGKVADHLIEKYLGQENSLFLSNIVICELIWVLERGYKYKKEQIVDLLDTILECIEFDFEDTEILWEALEIYKKHDVDFSDALISKIALTSNCKTTFTFDLKSSNTDNFTLLK